MAKVARQKEKKVRRKVRVEVADEGAIQIGSAPFDHQARTRLVFGVNCVERAGELARELGSKKVLLVTDAGIVAAGHAERVSQLLKAAGVKVTLFGKAREN